MQFNSNDMVSITEQGKRELDNGYITGHDYAIMTALDSHSPQSISSLARDSRTDIRQADIVVNRLQAQGRVSRRSIGGYQ